MNNPKNKKGNISLIIIAALAILLIAAAGAAGYFYLQTQKQSTISSGQSNNSDAVNTKFPTKQSQDETANWKTYTNDKYHFSIKYPNYFAYASNPIDSSLYLAPSEGSGEAKGSPIGLNQNDIWMEIDAMSDINSPSLEDFIELKEQQNLYSNSLKEKSDIGGVSGYRISQLNPFGPEGVVVYQGIVLNRKTIYRINMYAFNAATLKKNENLFNQILSTFKFTKSSQTNTNMEWQPWGMNGGPFISYPPGWTKTDLIDAKQYGVLFSGKEGTVELLWNGPMMGGPCGGATTTIETKIGKATFCGADHQDGEIFVLNNATSDQQLSNLKIIGTVKSPWNQNEPIIKQIISTVD